MIAIISVLASVVLASLGSSRRRANDAKIKSQLSSLRTQAELYYTSNNNYGTPVGGFEAQGTSIGPGCNTGMFSSSEMKPMLLSNKYPNGTTGRCTVSQYGVGYTVSARLSNAKWWIIDGKGNAVLANQAQGLYSDDATYTS